VKRVPFYLTQDQLDGLAQSLYKLQHLVDVASDSAPAKDLPFQLLSDLRRQCCYRSGAEDPFPELPFSPGLDQSRSGRLASTFNSQRCQ
jgi:hypothetical protein